MPKRTPVPESFPIPDRQQTATGLVAAWAALADLLTIVSSLDWHRDTRCIGWQVRDVAGHVAGLASDVARGRAGERTADEQAATLRHLSSAEMADHLRATANQLAPTLRSLTDAQWVTPIGGSLLLGHKVQTLLHDTYVHSDDIADALKLGPWDGPGIDASVATVTTRLRQRHWGPAFVHLGDRPPIAFQTGGPRICATAHQFVMVATGRLSPVTIGLAEDAGINVYRPT